MTDIAIRFGADDPRLLTQGVVRSGGKIVLDNVSGGCVLYGPYLALRAGSYTATVRFSEDGPARGEVTIDACSEVGANFLGAATASLEGLSNGRSVSMAFSLEADAENLEVRLHCGDGVSAEIVSVEICMLDVQPKLAESLLAGGRSADDVSSRLDTLERLARGGSGMYVGNNRVLIRVSAGDLILAYLMPADDRLLMPKILITGQHEPELTPYFLKSIPRNAHCLDVGANFGYYTCLMAELSRFGKTIGVEPDPEMFATLRDNIFINGHESFASPVQAAASDAAGELTLYRRNTRSANTSIIRAFDEYTHMLGEKPAEQFDVRSIAVDDLLPEFGGRIDFLKIDVEGAEPLAFRGMRKTLEANPQIRIIMEWSPGQIHAAGFDVGGFVGELEGLGLEAAIIDRDRLKRTPLRDLSHDAYYSGVLLTKRA